MLSWENKKIGEDPFPFGVVWLKWDMTGNSAVPCALWLMTPRYATRSTRFVFSPAMFIPTLE